MKYLLDTDTCVYWLRGRPSIRSRLAAIGPSEVGVSIITLAELQYGAACSTQPEANQQALLKLVGGLTLLGISPPITKLFADSKAALRSQGNLLEDLDLFIAATALSHALTLVTHNTAHFQRLAGLSLEDWF